MKWPYVDKNAENRQNLENEVGDILSPWGESSMLLPHSRLFICILYKNHATKPI
jgi:hypothetical protein